MNIFQAIILAIIEGITEFLPISSTGHLILVSKILAIPQNELIKSFEISIQSGAILAVVCLYFKKLTSDWHIWPKIFMGFLPTAIIGFILYPFIKSSLIGNDLIVVITLFLGGLVLIFIDRKNNTSAVTLDSLSLKKSAVIGLYQTLSVIPGVSRAAATIIGGQFTGLSKKDAVEFSFLMAIPTMTAATGFDLFKSLSLFNSSGISLILIGIFVSFLTALFSIKFFLRFIEHQTFYWFGIYRIIISLIYSLIFLY